MIQSDEAFIKQFCALFKRLPPQREWVTYDEWAQEKEQMVERMLGLLNVPHTDS